MTASPMTGLTQLSEQELQELTVIQASFGQAAIPNLVLNFIKNYR